MIKKYLKFINENKSEKNHLFINSTIYNEFIKSETEEIIEDLRDSLIDIEDLGHSVKTITQFISNDDGENDINGEKVRIDILLHINQKKEIDTKDWTNHINELSNINSIINDTTNRFSNSLECIYSKLKNTENVIKILITFLKDINLENLNKYYEKWNLENKDQRNILRDLLDYVFDEIFRMFDFDFDFDVGYIEYNDGFDIILKDYQTNSNLGVIGFYKKGDPIESVDIYYDDIEEINFNINRN
jgi:hypothetical protein